MAGTRYDELRERLAETWDLAKLGAIAAWDQQTMMPAAGGAVRARQLATISKVVHEQIVSEELGQLLEELRPYEESLDHDSDEASLIRVTRRDRDKELRVPGELREAQARAGAEAFPVWVEARRTDDFELFRPHLERNVDLRREYAACFEADEPYDALLDDFEQGMKTAEVREVFAQLRDGLVPIVAEASEQEIDDSCLRGHFPLEAQREMQKILLSRFGFREDTWRIDPVAHPFATSFATSDIRMTTLLPGARDARRVRGHARGRACASTSTTSTPRSSGRRSAAAPHSPCTSRRAACSRTSSGAASNGGAGPTRRCSACSPTSSAASSWRSSTGRSTRCSPR